VKGREVKIIDRKVTLRKLYSTLRLTFMFFAIDNLFPASIRDGTEGSQSKNIEQAKT